MDSFKVKPRLSKLRGQHFLTDKSVVAKIIKAGELTEDDLVLEVGPGLGVMTREILPRVKQLIVVELDPLFVRELRAEFSAPDNGDMTPYLDQTEIRGHVPVIVEGDILKMRISDLFLSDPLLTTCYKLVTNLPYNITSAFLKKFLLEPPHPERIVIMIQKEVAERIAGANSKPDGMLGLMCNLYAACSWVTKVGAGAFAPPPKVDSAVILLKPYAERDFMAKWGFEHGLAEDFLSFCNRFFVQPRKKMSGLLPKPLAAKLRLALSAIEESTDSRPAVLTLEKWVALWKKMR
jgi:16S rRNA (adenine1518-N6/adenine1519-N6)-dimethyltransferase